MPPCQEDSSNALVAAIRHAQISNREKASGSAVLKVPRSQCLVESTVGKGYLCRSSDLPLDAVKDL